MLSARCVPRICRCIASSQLLSCVCREEGSPPRRRERLPTPAQKEKSVSLWAILKVCIAAPPLAVYIHSCA